MLFDWISEIRHKRKLKQIKREQELIQASCVHEYEYAGIITEEWYNGIEVDFDDYHQAKCKKCHKIVKESYLNNLKVNCGLKEE